MGGKEGLDSLERDEFPERKAKKSSFRERVVSFTTSRRFLIVTTAIVGGLVFALILLFFVIPFLIRLDFLIGSSLIAEVEPFSQSKSLTYGERDSVLFSLMTNQYFTCRAACSYKFVDQSRNVILDNGSVVLSPRELFEKNYSIGVSRIGSGQDLYAFQAACHTVSSTFCPVGDETDKIVSSLVTVNYDLSGELKDLREVLFGDVTVFLERLNDLDVRMQKLSGEIFDLSFKTQTDAVRNRQEDIETDLDELRITAETIHRLWGEEEYIQVDGLFGNISQEHVTWIEEQIELLDYEIDDVVLKHNAFVSSTEDIHRELLLLVLLSDLYERYEYDDNFVNALGHGISGYNELVSMLSNVTFNSFEDVDLTVKQIEKDIEVLRDVRDDVVRHSFIEGQVLFLEEVSYFCEVSGVCSTNDSVASLVNHSFEIFNGSGFDDELLVDGTCNLFDTLEKEMVSHAESLEDNGTDFSSDDDFLTYASEKEAFVRSVIRDDMFNKFRDVQSSFDDDVDSTVLDTFSLYVSNWSMDFVVDDLYDENASLYLEQFVSFSDVADLFVDDACGSVDGVREFDGVAIQDFDLGDVFRNDSVDMSSRVETVLSDTPPLCCVFGDCTPCCTEDSCSSDESTYPIIFVHGHTIRGSNSPQFSLFTFDGLQARLEEDGYLNAGTLLYDAGTVEDGAWGRSGKPVTVKTTYYYDIYLNEEEFVTVPANSENIETYALRLRDVVDVVKKRTGKEKVNFIAFSMGGLVVRKYIQIFGEDSTHKVITVGSPHKGISGRVAGFCPVLGQSEECNDMLETSVFMKKLNDRTNQPEDVSFTTIIGKGCLTDGVDGDGIVRVSSSSIKDLVNSTEYFLEGSCSGALGQFHTDLIKLDEFPELYTIISEVLGE